MLAQHALAEAVEAKLAGWAKAGAAQEYYSLGKRGPIKAQVRALAAGCRAASRRARRAHARLPWPPHLTAPGGSCAPRSGAQVISELNRFGGAMGPYTDSVLQLQTGPRAACRAARPARRARAPRAHESRALTLSRTSAPRLALRLPRAPSRVHQRDAHRQPAVGTPLHRHHVPQAEHVWPLLGHGLGDGHGAHHQPDARRGPGGLERLRQARALLAALRASRGRRGRRAVARAARARGRRARARDPRAQQVRAAPRAPLGRAAHGARALVLALDRLPGLADDRNGGVLPERGARARPLLCDPRHAAARLAGGALLGGRRAHWHVHRPVRSRAPPPRRPAARARRAPADALRRPPRPPAPLRAGSRRSPGSSWSSRTCACSTS